LAKDLVSAHRTLRIPKAKDSVTTTQLNSNTLQLNDDKFN